MNFNDELKKRVDEVNSLMEETLSKVARELQLYNYMRYGNGEDINKIKKNDSIMCDTLESVFGAIYLDSNINEITRIVDKFILTEDNLNKDINDYKSKIQEIANANKIIIKYIVDKEEGPDHNKKFYVSLHYGEHFVGTGIGKTKKEAEQSAAKNTLEYIK